MTASALNHFLVPLHHKPLTDGHGPLPNAVRSHSFSRKNCTTYLPRMSVSRFQQRSNLQAAQVGMLLRVGNEGDREAILPACDHRETHAIYRNKAFRDDVRTKLLR